VDSGFVVFALARINLVWKPSGNGVLGRRRGHGSKIGRCALEGDTHMLANENVMMRVLSPANF
jgi:hypothetical protein